MKSSVAYLVSTIFILQTTLGSIAYAQQSGAAAQAEAPQTEMSPARRAELEKMIEERPYTVLLEKDVNLCYGKRELLESFIEEVPDTDADGNIKIDEKTKQPIKTKGKLTENENSYGERKFDFERLKTEFYTGKHDPKTKQCLEMFSRVARDEWQKLFNSLSEKYKCGLEIQQVTEDSGLVKVHSDTSKKSAECDIPYGNVKLSDWLKAQMEAFEKMNNDFEQPREEAKVQAQKASGAADRAQTEGKVCNEPGCKTESKEVKDIKFIKTIEERTCCERIATRWENLGFSTSKDAKPTDKICYDMINKDNDLNWCESRGCVGDIGNCVMNAISVFAKDFVKSFVESWDVFGWGSQLWALLKEVRKNPGEVGKNIVNNLLGGEKEYASCLNKKAMGQYVCQMIGKFFGNSAGFSAGLGALGGLFLGAGKGVIARLGAAESSLGKALAVDKDAKILKSAAKQSLESAKNGALAGFAWPYTASRGIVKGVTFPFKTALNNTGYFYRRAKAGAVSLTTLGTGKAVQGIGSKVAQSGTDGAKELGELLQKAGKNRIDLSKKITENAKQSGEFKKPATKLDEDIALAKKALNDTDELIAMRDNAKAILLKDKTINFNSRGKPIIPKGDARFMYYRQLEEQVVSAEKLRPQVVKSLDEMTKNKSTKTWNTLKGTLIIAPGVLGNSNKKGNNETPEQVKEGEKPASPVDGIGTGKTPPPQRQQAPQVVPKETPKSETKTDDKGQVAAPAAAAAADAPAAPPAGSNGGVPKAPGGND